MVSLEVNSKSKELQPYRSLPICHLRVGTFFVCFSTEAPHCFTNKNIQKQDDSKLFGTGSIRRKALKPSKTPLIKSITVEPNQGTFHLQDLQVFKKTCRGPSRLGPVFRPWIAETPCSGSLMRWNQVRRRKTWCCLIRVLGALKG